MVSLYESLLNNVHGGVRASVEEWCDKYIPTGVYYKINSKNEIYSDTRLSFNERELSLSDEDIPDIIKFGDMPECIFTTVAKLNNHPEKFPKVVGSLVLDMFHTDTIKNLDIAVTEHITFSFPQRLKHIENWKVRNYDKDRGYVLFFSLTDLPLKDLKELDCPGCTGLDLNNSPCGKELWNKINRMMKNEEHLEQIGSSYQLGEGTSDMLDKLFEKLPDVRFISLTSRRSLEHINGHWYVYFIHLNARRILLTK